MSLVVKDRVKQFSNTVGTGAMTLGGTPDGFQSFEAIGNANTTFYAIVDGATGDWEVGVGTYTASGTTLSRDAVLASSDSNELVDFGSGSKDVFVVYPADKSVFLTPPSISGDKDTLFVKGNLNAEAGDWVKIAVVDEKEVEILQGVWSAGGNLGTARLAAAGAGTQTAALAFGGGDGSVPINSTEEYDGTTWSTGGNLLEARSAAAGMGTQIAALTAGGNDEFFSPFNTTEEYNGTTWSAAGNMIEFKAQVGSAGTQTAALVAGGTSFTGSTEEYNGTTWSAGGNLNSIRVALAGAGTQTAALMAGGYNDFFDVLSSSEEYDGTTWSTTANMAEARAALLCAGTTLSAVVAGGFGAGFASLLNSSQEYDGSVWLAGGNLSEAKGDLFGAGSQAAALAVGGLDAFFTPLAATEEYNVELVPVIIPPATTGQKGMVRYNLVINDFEKYKSNSWIRWGGVEVVGTVTFAGVWSAGGALSTVRNGPGGAGTQSAGLAFGGAQFDFSTFSFVDLNSSEEYDGTSWSAGGTLATARSGPAGIGSQAAALAAGGNAGGSTISSSEEYNGTTWSSGGNLGTARQNAAGAGTQTAGLVSAGSDGSFELSSSEEYDGTTWSAGGTLATARLGPAGAGTQTAALVFGGLENSFLDNIGSTEEYNGTTWSAGGNLNFPRGFLGGAGTQTAALAFGGLFSFGDGSSFAIERTTEEYNGTTWSVGDNLITARQNTAGAGVQNAALAIGGFGGAGELASTEEYTIEAPIPVPTDGFVGELRFNTDTGTFQGYNGTSWVDLS